MSTTLCVLNAFNILAKYFIIKGLFRNLRMAGMEVFPIFEDDIVELIYQCKKNGILKRKIGTIVESSQNISSDEEDEDDRYYHGLRKNTVRVAWHPSGKTEVIEEVKLNILERSLLPGDVVTRMSNGQESQKGYITNCKMSCVLQCLTQPFIIFDVDSSLLVDFLPFHMENQQVYLDGWVGNVDRVFERIVLKFPDGARCELTTEDLVGNLTEFYDIHDRRDKSSEFFTNSFYIGQMLKGEMELMEGCTWLGETKLYSTKTVRKNKHKKVVVTIEELEVHSVDVMWLCRGYSEASLDEKLHKHPASLVSGKDLERLKVLDFFSACDYSLGSKAYYTTRKNDRIIHSDDVNKEDVRNEFIGAFNPKEATESEVGPDPVECNSSELKVVPPSQPTSNVSLPTENRAGESLEQMDENSNPSSHSPSKFATAVKKSVGTMTNARSQTSVGSFTRKPHKHQRAQGKPLKKKKISQKIKFGRFSKKVETLEVNIRVPVEVIALHSRVDILWQDGTRETNVPSGDLLPVQYVDNLEFFPGDYVSPAHPSEHLSLNNYGVIQRVNHIERTCIIQWYSMADGHASGSSMESLGDKEEVSVFDIKEHQDLRFRPGDMIVRVGGFGLDSGNSTVGGQVLESGVDGRLLVHWADGSNSFCKPVDVFLVTSDISDIESSSDESDYSDSYNDEMENFSVYSGGSWEWLTEEEVEEDDMDGDSSVLADRKSDRRKIIGELDIGDLESNISAFSVMKVNMEQHLITLDSILNKEKSVEIRKIVSSPMEDSSDVKADASLPQLDVGSKLDDSCDFDGFMAVILDLCNLHRSMHRLGISRFMVTWSFMKKYLEGMQGLMKKAKTFKLCMKTFAYAKRSFEINSKMASNSGSKEDTTKETASAKEEKLEEGAASTFDDPIHPDFTVESLFGISRSIRPDKSRYDIVRMFRGFVESLVAESDECHRLCVEYLDSKQRSNDIKFIDASECEGTPVDPGKSEENLKDAEVEEAKPEVMVESEPPVKSDVLSGGFLMLDVVPENHHFKKNSFTPINPKTFFSSVKKETTLLKTCLPKGIHIRGFDSRMDLFCVMIEGPANTPYEDGLFFFDVQLPSDYPKSPPKFHYVSYCSDRLNPNLYEDGKVCVSLLGTWSGRGTEIWNPSESNLLQVLISIQGLILNQEPYYNEAGYEKQKGSLIGIENCRMYNEMAVIKMVQSMTKLMFNPYEVFEVEIVSHMQLNSERFVNRLRSWMTVDSNSGTPEKKPATPENQDDDARVDRGVAATSSTADLARDVPVEEEATNAADAKLTTDTNETKDCQIVVGFPLFPVSKGFKISLSKYLDQFVSAAIVKSVLPSH